MQRIIRIITLGFIAGIALSWKLWFIEDRGFPLLPFADWVQDIFSLNTTSIPGGILVVSLIFAFIYPKRAALIPALGGMIILILSDQMRLQPWVYMYFFLLLPFALLPKNSPQQTYLPYLQIILIGMYLWSGIHKLNPNFIEITFSNMLRHFLGMETISGLRFLGYTIPCIEILTGLLLVIPRFRKAGVRLAVLTHLTIMVYLSPVGVNDNYVVIPWNVTLALLVILLFWDKRNSLAFWKEAKGLSLALPVFSLLLFGLMPALNFAGAWDDYLSFSLYSDKTKRYYIAIAENQVSRIDREVHPYFVNIEGMQGGEMIDVNEWAMEELNVPFYPERSAIRTLSVHFCKTGIPDEQLLFIEYQQPIRDNIFWSKPCSGVLSK